ncbi:MAG: hypothetical protein HYR49_11755 [Gammaproteobacteria bacterium]|nr:hypothetical protein [Gammaproteobacteria bacterium]
MIDLSRPYTSRNGRPTIDRVDARIFTARYFAECMKCSFCFDECCQHGTNISPLDEANILKHAPALEGRIGLPASAWFDNQWEGTVDFPGGKIMRARAYGGRVRNGPQMCVFAAHGGRGCILHTYALENNLSPYDVKPEDCHIFPLMYDNGALVPAVEIGEKSLICQGNGETLFRSMFSALGHFFGEAFVEELKIIDAKTRNVKPTART